MNRMIKCVQEHKWQTIIHILYNRSNWWYFIWHKNHYRRNQSNTHTHTFYYKYEYSSNSFFVKFYTFLIYIIQNKGAERMHIWEFIPMTGSFLREVSYMLSMLDLFNIYSNSIIYNVTITKKKIPTF
jgi:hypothetical protein